MPLIIPECYLHYKFVAIDPGLNHTGVAIFYVDFLSHDIRKIESYTISNDKLYDQTGFDNEVLSERVIKLYKLKLAIQQLLIYANPLYVTYETPFYNRFRPMAYGALLEVVNIIHNSTIEYNPNIPFYGVEPKYVKKHIGAKEMVGKHPMLDAVKQHDDIINVLENNIETLDQHSIDAIAVGYTFLKTKGLELC